MKRMFFKGILPAIIMLLLCSFAVPAFAAGSADANIGVQIEGGGTAYITPQVNCPVPDESELTLSAGETGVFHIRFTEPGE